ncbi:MAG: YbjQ family protein [Gammaproteobacteria bacterium]|nr:YbjQ family protein [Gammaproteobacteria bacterium]
MKNTLPILVACLLLAPSASARDSIGDYWINEVMTSNSAKTALGSGVLFFFGDEPHGEVVRSMGEIKTSKKTNALGKSDQEACHWVFLSAMKELKAHALKRGGNAVVNIRSNYKNKTTSSSETFKCGAGTLVAGVALIGTIIKME